MICNLNSQRVEKQLTDLNEKSEKKKLEVCKNKQISK